MSNLELCVARAANRDILNQIKRAASLVNDDYRASLLAHPELLEVPYERIQSGLVIMAVENGKIVGLADVSHRSDELELEGLFVDPLRWKRGIGRFLVEGAVAQYGGDAAAKTLHVVASPDAKAFYLACGFKIVGDTSTRFGPAIVMKLNA